jgi:hypothetical protein
MTDWDGTLGYSHRALQAEALALSLLRGHSVRLWLPWLNVGQIDPLVRLQDEYGSTDIDEIEAKRNRLGRPAALKPTARVSGHGGQSDVRNGMRDHPAS